MQKPPEEQHIASLQINFTPQGVSISSVLSPPPNPVAFTQVISPEVMDDLCKKWKEARKQMATAQQIAQPPIDLVKHIQNTKNKQ